MKKRLTGWLGALCVLGTMGLFGCGREAEVGEREEIGVAPVGEVREGVGREREGVVREREREGVIERREVGD